MMKNTYVGVYIKLKVKKLYVEYLYDYCSKCDMEIGLVGKKYCYECGTKLENKSRDLEDNHNLYTLFKGFDDFDTDLYDGGIFNEYAKIDTFNDTILLIDNYFGGIKPMNECSMEEIKPIHISHLIEKFKMNHKNSIQYLEDNEDVYSIKIGFGMCYN